MSSSRIPSDPKAVGSFNPDHQVKMDSLSIISVPRQLPTGPPTATPPINTRQRERRMLLAGTSGMVMAEEEEEDSDPSEHEDENHSIAEPAHNHSSPRLQRADRVPSGSASQMTFRPYVPRSRLLSPPEETASRRSSRLRRRSKMADYTSSEEEAQEEPMAESSLLREVQEERSVPGRARSRHSTAHRAAISTSDLRSTAMTPTKVAIPDTPVSLIHTRSGRVVRPVRE